jgi:hypothetical protein
MHLSFERLPRCRVLGISANSCLRGHNPWWPALLSHPRFRVVQRDTAHRSLKRAEWQTYVRGNVRSTFRLQRTPVRAWLGCVASNRRSPQEVIVTAIAYTFSIPATSADVAIAKSRVFIPEAPSKAALYRRRRIVVALSLVVAALLLGCALNAAVAAVVAHSHQPALIAEVSSPGVTEWTVASGDTLWSIAEATHPGEDPRVVVAKMQASGITSHLQIGDVVRVP